MAKYTNRICVGIATIGLLLWAHVIGLGMIFDAWSYVYLALGGCTVHLLALVVVHWSLRPEEIGDAECALLCNH